MTKWIWVCLLSVFSIGTSIAQIVPDSPPGRIIAYSAASTQVFLGSPSLAVLPDGSYLVSHDTFGPGAKEDQVSLFASHDKGLTWKSVGQVPGQYWSSLFVAQGSLYLFGTDRSMGTPVIRRSDNGGATWTKPLDPLTGRFSMSSRYITGAVPVLVDHGRIWKTFEIAEAGDLREIVMSAPVNANLLDTATWVSTTALRSAKSWLNGDFLSWEEGNMVPTGQALPSVVMRVNTKEGKEKDALVSVTSDGALLSFDPTRDFVDMPGGGKKFTIRFDTQTKLYWSLTNAVQENNGHENLERVRNTLALISSPDLRNWTIRRVLMNHPDRQKHGFQYADWQIEGDDIIAVIRVAFDDAQGGAQSQHNSNYITFMRFSNFRQSLAQQAVSLPG
jgi:hypothetical protein